MTRNLTGNMQAVFIKQSQCLCHQPMRGFEESQFKSLAVEFETMTNNVKSTLCIAFLNQRFNQLAGEFRTVELFHLLPQIGLSGFDKIYDVFRKQRFLFVPQKI